MKIKFGTLLAMLLCGASVVTHAVPITTPPITYDHNYSGVYTIEGVYPASFGGISKAWTFGYSVNPSEEALSEWEYTLYDAATATDTRYRSSEGSFFRIIESETNGGGMWQFFTAPVVLPGGSYAFSSAILKMEKEGACGGACGAASFSINVASSELDAVDAVLADFRGIEGDWFVLFTTGLMVFGDISDPYLWGGVEFYGAAIRFQGEEVPEPASVYLLGIGLAAFGVSRRRLRG